MASVVVAVDVPTVTLPDPARWRGDELRRQTSGARATRSRARTCRGGADGRAAAAPRAGQPRAPPPALPGERRRDAVYVGHVHRPLCVITNSSTNFGELATASGCSVPIIGCLQFWLFRPRVLSGRLLRSGLSLRSGQHGLSRCRSQTLRWSQRMPTSALRMPSSRLRWRGYWRRATRALPSPLATPAPDAFALRTFDL